ncbi:uncharacterized protein LOC133819456 [Humulus lupulus]|uniref:uncharacterized protein LOC133819456 n=1 Tax=Humulus lupulus TaxID=3486 RepID=UPI002B406AD2|nr:uncharacterized protein LOC133819456 [Humulus lupulus]
MPKTKAVTHADLAPSHGSTYLGSKVGVVLIILTILCGLLCFILCLISEATRSEMTWIDTGRDKGSEGNNYECVYSGSGRTPLLCAAVAFVGLALAMTIEHIFMLIAVSKLPPSAVATFDPDFGTAKNLTCQAGFFFVTTWICFAVGEILLLIGLSIESGHLKNWSKPRASCLVIREGLFSAAGVLALTSVFLAAGLYLTALKAQKIAQENENMRLRILETSALYASPPRSPTIHPMTAIDRENPIFRDDPIEHTSAFVFPLSYSKDPNLV